MVDGEGEVSESQALRDADSKKLPSTIEELEDLIAARVDHLIEVRQEAASA